MLSDLLALSNLAEDVTFRLRRDHERGSGPMHRLLMISLIAGYLAEHPGQFLFPADDPVCGLASHFALWLKQHPPQGGGSDGEELRGWVSEYAT